ncbi:MAG: zinc ribbon domain-containing protein [Thermoanaerobaculia bacterium]
MHHPVRMRLLVSCPSCKRQYDAGELQAGDRFHCLCSEILEVPVPSPHDAAVVRCSACGAPRQAESATCRFCDADFTLHERDLHTICPACMARVSDRARYCHHCATPLLPAGRAGERSLTPCPACSDSIHLTSRELGQPPVSVLECPRCAGLWLAKDTAQVLMERVREASMTTELTSTRKGSIETVPAAGQDQTRLYRPCPVCGKLMHRLNFGRKSGIIVDSCRPHGLWFDANELDAVVRWIRTGGESEARRLRREMEADLERRADFDRQMPTLGAGSGWSESVAGSGSLLSLLGWLLDRILNR